MASGICFHNNFKNGQKFVFSDTGEKTQDLLGLFLFVSILLSILEVKLKQLQHSTPTTPYTQKKPKKITIRVRNKQLNTSQKYYY
jgi:hypothetical protein